MNSLAFRNGVGTKEKISSIQPSAGRAIVLIAARDGSHRTTIANYLQRRGMTVMLTASAAEAMEIAQSGIIDIVVTGPAMPGLDGYELTRNLRVAMPELPVILMSAGGTTLDNTLLDCAMAVGEQQVRNVSPDPYRGLNSPRSPERLSSLTRREHEVLTLVAQGYANKAVARMLSISPRTVENHRAQVMRKTNTRSLAELVRLTMSQNQLAQSA